MKTQKQFLDLLKKKVLEIDRQVLERIEEQEKQCQVLQADLNTRKAQRITKETQENSVSGLEKVKSSLEQAGLDAEQARLDKEKTIKDWEDNRSYLMRGVLYFKKIGKTFKEKVFKGPNNSALPAPLVTDRSYTYLNPTKLVWGGAAVVAGGFFFLYGGPKVAWSVTMGAVMVPFQLMPEHPQLI